MLLAFLFIYYFFLQQFSFLSQTLNMFFKRSYSLSKYMEKMLRKEPRIDEYRTTTLLIK